MSIEIQGKNILVTGANRGIGKAITERLLQSGAAKVYGAVRNVESLVELQEEYGDRLVAIKLDLTKPESIQAAADTAVDVDVVVNNAGVLRLSDALSETAIEDLEFELNGNVFGLLRVAQAFAPVLKSNGGGALVQLNSIVSMKSFEQFATYSASKAAAYSLTQSLRLSLREQGTQVVSVHPGPILTDMGNAAGLAAVAEPPELVADAIINALSEGEFHAFAGEMADQVGAAYQGFANNVVEAELSEV